MATKATSLQLELDLYAHMRKTPKDLRNRDVAKMGFAVKQRQLSVEARTARITGTPTEKALDWDTTQKASRYGERYAARELEAARQAYNKDKEVGCKRFLTEFCERYGRNYLAARAKAIQANRR